MPICGMDRLRKTRYSKFNGFNVATGETIMAYLTLGPGGNSAKLIIKNLTTGYMAIPVDMAAPAGAPAVGATAEWVVERPNIQGSDKVWTFPNYGTVVMNQCVAGFGANPAAGLLGEQTLEYARTINLVTWDDPLHLGETVSSAEVLNDQSILASYVPR